jgi:hypothetical protein
MAKQFTVVSRDSVSPDPTQWIIAPPNAGTKELLKIRFGEALDYGAARDAIHILDSKEENISGSGE